MVISVFCLHLNVQMTLTSSCLDTDGDGLDLAREISWSKSCPLWLHLHWTQYRWDQKLNFPHKLLAAFFGESSQKAAVIQLSNYLTHINTLNSTIPPSDSLVVNGLTYKCWPMWSLHVLHFAYLYLFPLVSVLRKHGHFFHCYADSQIYFPT